MKKLLILTIFLLTYVNCFSQWWTKGGNLIWPYGNVNITKGNLMLNHGDMTLSDGALNVWYGGINVYESDLYLQSGEIRGNGYTLKHDSVTFDLPDNNTLFSLSDEGDYSSFHVHLDDHGYYSGNVTLDMDVEEGLDFEGSNALINTHSGPITLEGVVRLNGSSKASSNTVSNPPADSELTSIFGSKISNSNAILYLDDTANNIMYLVTSTGYDWFYVALTKAL
jgi:hypothetical protein